MEKQLNEIAEKRNEVTKQFHKEINYIDEGLKSLGMDEIPEAMRQVIVAEIKYGFEEKWKMYNKMMHKFNAELEDLKKSYYKEG